MSAVWPLELPQTPLLGCVISRQPNTVAFAVDAGPAKLRRRSTKGRTIEKTQIELTGEQLGIFWVFYTDTLNDGVLPFEWKGFRAEQTVQFRFVNAPEFTLQTSAVDTNKRVYTGDIQLEVM